MDVSVKLDKCKCGNGESIVTNTKGAWIYCRKSKWWNFFLHRKRTQLAWYP